MIGIDIGLVLISAAILISSFRIAFSATDADRVVATDLLYFSMIGLIALMGVRIESSATFDVILVATLIGFFAAIALARALTKGKR